MMQIKQTHGDLNRNPASVFGNVALFKRYGLTFSQLAGYANNVNV
jgi:hypothetical protein